MSHKSGILLLVILASSSCVTVSVSERGSRTEGAIAPVDPQPASTPLNTSRSVEFEGVSFTYDPSVFGGVKTELVPDYPLDDPDFKPDGVEPEHVQFTFDLHHDYSNAELAVFPLNRFPEMYAKNPYSVTQMKREIEALRQLVKNKDYRFDGQIPHLRFADASLDFFVHVKDLVFAGGKGVVFVTHWNTEASLISNRNLIYRFEGITDDGKWYVTAETPIRVDALPYEQPDEFEGYKWEDGLHSEQKRKKYVDSISSRLARLKPDDFTPRLAKFEEIISSLRIAR